MWSTSEITERMVRIGGTWLRVSAVDAIEPALINGDRCSFVYLRGGARLTVDATRDAIANALWETADGAA